MTNSQLYEIKCEIISKLHTQEPLSQEEIVRDSQFEEADVEKALEKLEAEEMLTTKANQFFYLTEKAKKKHARKNKHHADRRAISL